MCRSPPSQVRQTDNVIELMTADYHLWGTLETGRNYALKTKEKKNQDREVAPSVSEVLTAQPWGAELDPQQPHKKCLVCLSSQSWGG